MKIVKVNAANNIFFTESNFLLIKGSKKPNGANINILSINNNNDVKLQLYQTSK